jgi:hypothetical protein
MPPLVRVGRSFRGTVSLPVSANLSNPAPVDAHFHFWPPVLERAAARAMLLGDALAVAAWLRLPALVLEGRPDRCAVGEPPLVVSTWRYASGGSGAAELSLPLLPGGRAWCLTVRSNGSAAATLAWNIAASAEAQPSTRATVTGTTRRGSTTGTMDGTTSTPNMTRAVSVPGTTTQAALPSSTLAALTSLRADTAGQIAFVLQVRCRFLLVCCVSLI